MSDGSAARERAVSIVRRLRDAGYESFLAGGCVRDELLGLSPKDYDVATAATPEVVATLFARTREVGRAFGVMHVPIDRIVTEVATFRVESDYTDRRRPDEVRFAGPEEDASRRDFTVNALFIDPLDESGRAGGRVIDFVGGVADLEAKVIRAVGDPDERLAEDDLRSLRAVRFASRLGFEIEDATRAAIERHAGELIGVSRERVGEEVRRMLAHPSRARAVHLLHDLGLEAPVLLLPAIGVVGEAFLGSLPDDAGSTLGLASWVADRTLALEGGALAGVPARTASHAKSTVGTLRRAMVLSNEETETLSGVLNGVEVVVDRWATLREAHQKRAASSSWFGGALALVRAGWPGVASSVEARVGQLASRHGGLAPAPLVTGDDLVGCGYEPGPGFKRWLDDAYDLQLEGEVTTREAGLEAVRGWAGDPNAS